MSSLLAVLALVRRPRRLRRPPALVFPHNAEREYRRELKALLEPGHALVLERLFPELPAIVAAAGLRRDELRLDVYAEQVERVMQGVSLEYERRVPAEAMRGAARRAASQTSTHNRVQVNRQVKAVLGVDVFQSEPWIDGALDGWTRENVSLIKSIPRKYFDEVEQLVLRRVRAGERAEAIVPELERRYDVARNRAELIAEDQIGKLNGQLTAQRHQDLGLRRYRWRNSRDERVRGNPAGLYPDARPSHWTREGQVFSYAKPPEGGAPGQPVRCRCYPEPVFDDLLGKGFGVDQTPAPAATAFTALSGREGRRSSPDRKPAITDGMTLTQAEAAIRKRSVEHLGAFDQDGRLLHAGVGGRASAPVPDSLLQLTRKNGQALITHNHPGSSTFSPEDLAVAVVGNLRELRAVVPGGGAWVVRRPLQGWRARGTYRSLVDSLTQAYNLGTDRATRRMDQLMADGRRRRMGRRSRDALWRRIANEEIARAYAEWSGPAGWRVEFER